MNTKLKHDVLMQLNIFKQTLEKTLNAHKFNYVQKKALNMELNKLIKVINEVEALET